MNSSKSLNTQRYVCASNHFWALEGPFLTPARSQMQDKLLEFPDSEPTSPDSPEPVRYQSGNPMVK